MSELHDRDLIHDWNLVGDDGHRPAGVSVVDDTLYEAMHSPAAVYPDAAGQIDLLRCMHRLQLRAANLGALSTRTLTGVVRLARVIADEKLRLTPICTIPAGAEHVDLVRRAVQDAAQPLQVAMVVHMSEIHQRASGLDLAAATRSLDAALAAALHDGLKVRLMAHDATRAHPASLRRLLNTALDRGVSRICIWDSAGQASPTGTARIIDFVRAIVDDHARNAHLEWFGRNDRDLSIINSLHALYHGADTLHATALGLGHGAGNTPVDILLANLQLLEIIDRDLSMLKEYCDTAARAYGVNIPVNYPIFGADAFRTATGVHAAAIIKAQVKGDQWLADRVYSGVPAGVFGLHQVIDVGPMSGESNVVAWLRHRSIEPRPELVKRIIHRAKSTTHILTVDEISEEIQAFDAGGAMSPHGR